MRETFSRWPCTTAKAPPQDCWPASASTSRRTADSASWGGLPDETLWPLDVAPEPGRPARTVLDEAAVAADLERLAGQQKEDGGWTVDFQSHSPAAALEWRGYATVRALSVLQHNAMDGAPA